MIQIIDFILHVDKYIDILIANYGIWVYFLVFLVIFIETGIVIMPFLPGDSLLFVLGAFASRGTLSLWVILISLFIAAVVGDTINYSIGKYFGEKVFSRFIKKEHLDKTRSFYQKYGDKTIVIARFVPIVRTLAPFLAGVARMRYPRFLSFNVIGGLLWVFIFVLAGFFFGNIPIIKDNLSIVIILIIIISVIPAIIEYLRARKN